MSPSIALISDSTADFPAGRAGQLGLHFAPIHVYVDEADHLDGVTIDNAKLVQHLWDNREVKTAPPYPGEYATHFDRLLAGHDHVISFHVSSKLSGCFNSAKSAVNFIRGDVSGRITLIDTRNLSIGQALLVEQATELLQAGLPAAELPAALEPYMAKSHLFFTVEKLTCLRRGGRIGALAAFMGSMLNIKPVIVLSDGAMSPVDKIRGKQATLDRMAAMAAELQQTYGRVRLSVAHVDSLEDATYLRRQLTDKLGLAETSIPLVGIGATIAAHAGPGCCACALMAANP